MDRGSLAELDRVLRSAVGRLPDQDPVHRGSRLHARGSVDDVAGNHPLALGGPRIDRYERLARVDRDPDLERGLLDGPVADRERCAYGALRVVLVRGRRAEDGHDRVADELLHGAAVPLELGSQARLIRREHAADVLGVEPFRLGGEPDEIHEDDRDRLPLLAERALHGFERSRARVAEPGAFRVLLTTTGASHRHLGASLVVSEVVRPRAVGGCFVVRVQ